MAAIQLEKNVFLAMFLFLYFCQGENVLGSPLQNDFRIATILKEIGG